MPGITHNELITVICCLQKAQCGARVCIVNLCFQACIPPEVTSCDQSPQKSTMWHRVIAISMFACASLTENFELGTSLAVASILATVTVLFSAKASPTCMVCGSLAQPDQRSLFAGGKLHCPCLLYANACAAHLFSAKQWTACGITTCSDSVMIQCWLMHMAAGCHFFAILAAPQKQTRTHADGNIANHTQLHTVETMILRNAQAAQNSSDISSNHSTFLRLQGLFVAQDYNVKWTCLLNPKELTFSYVGASDLQCPHQGA